MKYQSLVEQRARDKALIEHPVPFVHASTSHVSPHPGGRTLLTFFRGAVEQGVRDKAEQRRKQKEEDDQTTGPREVPGRWAPSYERGTPVQLSTQVGALQKAPEGAHIALATLLRGEAAPPPKVFRTF